MTNLEIITAIVGIILVLIYTAVTENIKLKPNTLYSRYKLYFDITVFIVITCIMLKMLSYN
nr:MAG TPA: hypothetical protein [Caudoviricetes sp.]